MAEALSTNAVGAARARGFAIGLLAALALVSLLAAYHGERSAVTFGLLVVFLVGPLAIAVPGLLARNRRTYAWATLCVTPHFIYALTEIVANPAIRVLAASILLLGLALVVALIAYLRLTRVGGGEDDGQGTSHDPPRMGRNRQIQRLNRRALVERFRRSTNPCPLSPSRARPQERDRQPALRSERRFVELIEHREQRMQVARQTVHEVQRGLLRQLEATTGRAQAQCLALPCFVELG